jgi:uncharacterized membrane protein (UPF0127 family)
LLLAVLLTGLAARAWAAMPRADLWLGMFRIEAEIAANNADRQLGLMNRASMPVYQGMVFVFPVAAQHCMWMKNTRIALSVAFLDDEGRIVNIEDMAPETEDSHCAAKPARFALEMNQGWFAARGFKAGDAVRGVKDLPASH